MNEILHRFVRVDDSGEIVEEASFDSIEGRFHPDLSWLQSDTLQVGMKWDDEAKAFVAQ